MLCRGQLRAQWRHEPPRTLNQDRTPQNIHFQDYLYIQETIICAEAMGRVGGRPGKQPALLLFTHLLLLNQRPWRCLHSTQIWARWFFKFVMFQILNRLYLHILQSHTGMDIHNFCVKITDSGHKDKLLSL
jgi:hypothetical protein